MRRYIYENVEKDVVIGYNLLTVDSSVRHSPPCNNRGDIMDREQQINELQKVICHHCFEMTEEECANPEHMRFVKGEAEAYYDAGFRYKPTANTDDFAEERKAWQKKRIELETTIAELKLEKEARLNCDFVKTAQKNAVKDAVHKIESLFAYYDDGDTFSKQAILDKVDEILKECEK